MIATDLHSELYSMEQSLAARQTLVDGRTERDWLSFMASYAPLINFYDQYNRQRGNWEPFILKDPVFLMAAVSKTNAAKHYKEYRQLCTTLDTLLQNTSQDENQKNKIAAATGEQVNQLFDALIRVFLVIRRWVYYMQLSDTVYPLKSFTIQQVKAQYSGYFWAIVSLRQNLFLSSLITGIKPVNHAELCLFDAVDEMIWKQYKDKSPCWDVLGLQYPLKLNSTTDLVKAITQKGNEVFQFQQHIIEQAPAAFEELKTKRCRFPDTLLLRAFADMLTLYKDQLNGITAKHLQFGYKNILRFNERAAVPDRVFICAELAKKDTVVQLPAGTLFDAGSDEQKRPVSFLLPAPVVLNPGIITSVYTISTIKGTDNRYRIFRQHIPDPGTIHRDENGQVQPWRTFGGLTPLLSIGLKQAISFGSPLLLLREGERRITVTLNFADPVNPAFLSDTTYYLSTQKAWMPVKGTLTVEADENQKICQATILLVVDAAQAPVEPFQKDADQKDPDGLKSVWPLFKIEFASFTDPASPPLLTSLKIEVTVRGIKTVQLFNDFGALTTKTPFQLFGPTPLKNSHFIIGSNEVFSKPLNALQLHLAWEKPPADFSMYYAAYNQHIKTKLQPVPPAKKTSVLSKITTPISNVFKKITHWIGSIFRKKEKEQDCPHFNNTSFTVDFSILQQQSWDHFDVYKIKNKGAGGDTLINAPYEKDTTCACRPEKVDDLLFSTGNEKCEVLPDSYFMFDKKIAGTTVIKPDPALQYNPLQYTGTNSSGFMRVSITGPEYGFGSGLYPAIVSAVALDNAWALFNSPPKEDFFGFKDKSKKPAFIEQASLPFVPLAAGIDLNYTATQEYFFTKATGDYPVECFLYTPFEPCKIYDATHTIQSYTYTIDLTGAKDPGSITGIPMFQSVTNQGNLFCEMDQLIPATEMSFFFELAGNYQKNSTGKNIGFNYISNEGWRKLAVISDNTRNFCCSGTVAVAIPGDITNNTALMPGNKYWLVITADKDPAGLAQTVCLKPNGFQVQRSAVSLYDDGTTPALAAGIITKTVSANPLIATISQPFPSFGGKAAEQEEQLWLRAANRIKTKDRAITTGDYYRLVRQEFTEVYYSKTICPKNSNVVSVLLVKAITSDKDPHAFLPLVNDCTMLQVKDFLKERTNAFSALTVSNFTFQSVQVQAVVRAKTGYSTTRIESTVKQALKLFFSPWINGSNSSLIIDQPLTNTQVVAFIKSQEGVAEVVKLSFISWPYDGSAAIPANLPPLSIVSPLDEYSLLITAADHAIECKTM